MMKHTQNKPCRSRLTRLVAGWIAGASVLAAASVQAAPAAQTGGLVNAQNRLQALQGAGLGAGNYNWEKAQCWLVAATTAQSENDRSGFAGQAQQEAEQLLSVLEADKSAAPRYGSSMAVSLRPDLQAHLKDLQTQHGAKCGAQNLACAEVQLARATHELNRFGRRAAAPYLQVAQCAVDEAKKQIAACAPPPAPLVREQLRIDADGYFYFDRSGGTDLLPEGRKKIEDLAQTLKTWKKIESVHIIGFTDRLGSEAYNLRLSQARAETVRSYLQSQQVPVEQISVAGLGKLKPVTTPEQCPSTLPRKALIDCLQPDRRIEIQLIGSK
ncbi:MAG: OmpA family protein [Brachymonas sp.]|jgi:OOP family OmpA-OmpF porin